MEKKDQFSYYENNTSTVSNARWDFDMLARCIVREKYPEIREIIPMIRDHVTNGEIKKAKALKDKLPAITIGGVFAPTRKASNLVSYTGMIVLDVDGKDQDANFEPHAMRDALGNFGKWFRLVCISPSGDGLKIIAMVRGYDPKQHKAIFEALASDVESAFPIKIDRSGSDITRMMYITHDRDAWVFGDERRGLRDKKDWGWDSPLDRLERYQWYDWKQPAPEDSSSILMGEMKQYTSEEIERIQKEYEERKRAEYQANEEKQPAKQTKNKASDLDKIKSIVNRIEESGTDITKEYHDWINIAFGLVNEMGEAGRDYFHRISRYYPNYDPKESDGKYTDAMKNGSGSVRINTILDIAKKYGITYKTSPAPKPKSEKPPITIISTGDYWEIDSKSRCTINERAMYDYLKSQGITRLKIGEKPIELVRIHENICTPVDADNLREIIKQHIESLPINDEDKTLIFNAVGKGATMYFHGDRWPLFLEITTDPKFLRDTNYPPCTYVFYTNNMAKITPDGIEIMPYSKSDGLVWDYWKHKEKKRDAIAKHSEDFQSNDFYKLLQIVTTPRIALDVSTITKDHDLLPYVDSDRFNALRWYLGYLCSNPITNADRFILHFCEDNTDEGSQGRSGKNLISQTALKHIRRVSKIGDNRGKSGSVNFAMQNIDPRAQIAHWGDVDPNYLQGDFVSDLFEKTTDGFFIERKHQHPIWISGDNTPRWISTGNTVPKIPDGSSQARLRIMELYSQFNVNYSPINFFGRGLFEAEWDAHDWACFDNVIWECIQYYLKNRTQHPKYISGTLLTNQFRVNTHPDWESFIVRLLDEDPFEKFGNMYPLHFLQQKYAPPINDESPEEWILDLAIGSSDLINEFKLYVKELGGDTNGITSAKLKHWMELTIGYLKALDRKNQFFYQYRFRKVSGKHFHMIFRRFNIEQMND